MTLSTRVSAVGFLVVACYIIIFGFLWRAASSKLADHPIGKAMSVIF